MTTESLARASMPGEDPAVLTWRVALAPRPRIEPVGRHWWRDLAVSVYRDAKDARDALRQSGQDSGGRAAGTAHSGVCYAQLSDDEFSSLNPPVTFRDVLQGLSGGRIEPPW